MTTRVVGIKKGDQVLVTTDEGQKNKEKTPAQKLLAKLNKHKKSNDTEAFNAAVEGADKAALQELLDNKRVSEDTKDMIRKITEPTPEKAEAEKENDQPAEETEPQEPTPKESAKPEENAEEATEGATEEAEEENAEEAAEEIAKTSEADAVKKPHNPRSAVYGACAGAFATAALFLSALPIFDIINTKQEVAAERASLTAIHNQAMTAALEAAEISKNQAVLQAERRAGQPYNALRETVYYFNGTGSDAVSFPGDLLVGANTPDLNTHFREAGIILKLERTGSRVASNLGTATINGRYILVDDEELLQDPRGIAAAEQAVGVVAADPDYANENIIPYLRYKFDAVVDSAGNITDIQVKKNKGMTGGTWANEGAPIPL